MSNKKKLIIGRNILRDEKRELLERKNKIKMENSNSTEKPKSENSKTDKSNKIKASDFDQYLDEILKGSDSILGC